MCGRFSLPTPEELTAHFNLKKTPKLEPRYNIAPSQDIAVLRLTPHTSGRELALLRWGLVPFWAKDQKISYKMINARAESVAGKPAFRAAFRHRRCLIPASGFFEWSHKIKTKQPHYIRLKDSNIFAFAGLWEYWAGDNGETVNSCTIITTEANKTVGNIHDRMPAIIEPELYDRWLAPGTEEKNLLSLLTPFPDTKMLAYPVGIEVNNPRNDTPACLTEKKER
ncbi:MAG: SOS response-associated peptidase [Nitrospirota bacterium]